MSHGPKFTSTYVRESVQESLKRSAIDRLADITSEIDYVAYRLHWLPVDPGSLQVYVNGNAWGRDSRDGRICSSESTHAGQIDYRTGELRLKRCYVRADDEVEVGYDYEP